jgi:hypothetical protein
VSTVAYVLAWQLVGSEFTSHVSDDDKKDDESDAERESFPACML